MSEAQLLVGLVVSSVFAVITLTLAIRQSLRIRRTREALMRMNISMSNRHWYVPE